MNNSARAALAALTLALALPSALPALAGSSAPSPAKAGGDPALPRKPDVGPSSAGVPHKTCRVGFAPAGAFLCMTPTRGPATFVNAMFDCNTLGARVADYHDWRYRNLRGDGAAAPVGFWLGPITADNTALFSNMTNPGDFDGETSRFDNRNYACAHDILR